MAAGSGWLGMLRHAVSCQPLRRFPGQPPRACTSLNRIWDLGHVLERDLSGVVHAPSASNEIIMRACFYLE